MPFKPFSLVVISAALAFAALSFIPQNAAHGVPHAPAPSAIPTDSASIPPVTAAEVTTVMGALPTLKGASIATVVIVITQVLMLLMRSPIGAIAGVWKLVIVQGLTIVLGYVAFWVSGTPILTALFDSTMLGFAQVFVHQLITQVSKAPGDIPKPVV